MRNLLLALRAALFYLPYAIATGWFSVTGVLFTRWLPIGARGWYLGLWNYFTLYWLWITCGVRFEVRGKENLPPGPCVLLSKHQSQWETFYLQLVKRPVTTVLKKELLEVPFFGWGLALLEPIAIDRSNPKQALRSIQEQGLQRLQQGRSVIIFPEGTRTAPGQSGNYARSGAELAVRAGVPIVPVAHNAGRCWPPRRFLKFPGTVQLVFGAPIDTRGGNSRELTEQVRQWIEAEVAAMDGTASDQSATGSTASDSATMDDTVTDRATGDSAARSGRN
jgi:1-acyl-sn-glycerol-3-phosphate acyltransferase